jgi:hypothetical protein
MKLSFKLALATSAAVLATGALYGGVISGLI